MASFSSSRVVAYSLLGGLAGALVMGMIAYMMPIPNSGGAPFFVAAAMSMGVGSMAWIAGWALHLLTGVVIGGIFGFLVAKVSFLQLMSRGRALGLGTIAGVVVWVAFFIPMMASLMPSLMSMTALVGGSLVAHIAFGLVLGGVASLAKPNERSFKCPACGSEFGTQQEMADHRAKSHQM